MPGSCGSEGSTGSPSLITNLRRYSFQGQGKSFQPGQVASSVETVSSSVNPAQPSSISPAVHRLPSNAVKTPPDVRSSSDYVPETPDSLRCSGPTEAKSSGTPVVSSSNGSSFAQRILSYKHSSVSGSNTPSPSDNIAKRSPGIASRGRSVMDEYDTFCEKEHCLRELLKHFPSADIMEAQDILVSTQWNLEKAVEIAKSKPLKTARRRTSSSAAASAPQSKGVVFSDTTAVNNNPTANTSSVGQGPEEIVLDSDDSVNNVAIRSRKKIKNKAAVHNGYENSVNTNSSVTMSSEKGPRKKRKRVIISDDSDDDVTPLPVVCSSDVSQRKTSFSILDYEPENTSLISSPQRPSTSSSNAQLSTGNSSHQHPDSSHRKSEAQNESKVKQRKKRKKEEYEVEDVEEEEEYGNCDVYDSEESDVEESLTPARSAVLSFFQDAILEELSTIPGCSKKKAEIVIKYRPFTGWVDLVQKLNCDKTLSGDLLNGAKKVLDMRTAVSRLMNKCQRIALEMEDLVEALKENKEDCKDYVSKQPGLLNSNMHLTPYQMLGLNWLLLMHNQEVNGILADEMGLGKTVQAISFLAYLKEQHIRGPHLIVVPSSTLDNWQNEFRTWWPSVFVLCYHGSQENRRELRMQIINDEVEEFDIMVTTYNMVASSAEDRGFFKKLEFNYVVFDEAHMLKNMASQRYQHLMRVKASRRLLLTGTPLQNNLVELMSLLIFAMPHMFSGKTEQVKQMFSAVCKSDEGKTKFERERIEHAKRIMKPFVLRRLKNEVLKDLPAKHEEIKFCKMSNSQAEHYRDLVIALSEEVKSNKEKDITTSGAGMMMQLRKAANHPLLLRNLYSDDKLLQMAKLMLKEPTHSEANPDLIFEDMCVMSDFELHKLCKQFKSLKSFILNNTEVLGSGKFAYLDSTLPKMIDEGSRILLFSQFTMILDIIQEYMKIRKYKYLRLDGQIPVSERQQLIDEFNQNSDIPLFLLSTRAGGLGINLTTANVVLIHDIDFNPYNDKQAEDRCHRVGQLRDVTVVRMISEDTIEEGMLQRANEKLKLEKDVTASNEDEERDSGSVARLLRDALGISPVKS